MKKTIKIMEVIYSFELGGAERLSADLAKYFKDHGINVAVCSTHEQYGPIRDLLEGYGIECFSVNAIKQNKIFTLFKIFMILIKYRPDILHIHHIPMLWLFYYPSRLLGIKKIVVTEHTDNEIKNSLKLQKIAKKYVPRISMLTVVHERMKQYFHSQLQINNNKIVTINNGVDVLKFYKRACDHRIIDELKIPQGSRIIGFVGRFHPDKDIDNLVEAFKLLNSANPDNKNYLILIGSGETFEIIKQKIAMLELDNKIFLLGEKKHIDEYLNCFDLFVLPSQTEGMPIALLEAMSVGVPCVATDVGGVRDVITEQVGVIVPKSNPKELAKGIELILEDDKYRKSLSSNCVKRINKKYKKDIIYQTYLNIMQL